MEGQVNKISLKTISKFRFWPKLLMICLALLLCFIDIFYLINIHTYFAYDKPFHFVTYGFLTLNPIVLSLTFREINEKAYKIIIDGDTIIKIRNFGFGFRKRYKTDAFTGFFTYSTTSGKNAAEYLYLVIGEDKPIKLSTFYHENYHELKASIIQHHIEDLGTERWGIWKHLSERTW